MKTKYIVALEIKDFTRTPFGYVWTKTENRFNTLRGALVRYNVVKADKDCFRKVKLLEITVLKG